MRKIDALLHWGSSPENDGMEVEGVCSVAADALAFPAEVWQHPSPIAAFGLRADEGERLDERFVPFAMVA
jgi:hypothetical protein